MGEQDLVNERFESEAQWWSDLYEQDGVYGRVIQHRHAMALAWVDQLALRSGSAVLEVGCGTGVLAADLALRGLVVRAIDSVPRMVDLARDRFRSKAVSRLATAEVGDVQHLDFPASSFDLVTALGVIDWVPSPGIALHEMVRVLRPGGYLILSCGHPGAFAFMLDPMKNLMFAPIRLATKRFLELMHLRERRSSLRMYRIGQVDRLVSRGGLDKVDGRTVGFGPLTLFNHRALPEAMGVRINGYLQALADARVPIIRSQGMGYMVLARKA